MPSSAGRCRFYGIVFSVIVCGLLASSPAWAANDKNLIRVKDSQGKETALFEKVVVVSSKGTLSTTPDGSGEPIEPWAIFFRIRNADGSASPQNGKLRVGDATGNPIGWIGEKNLKVWSTRFILDPIDPQRDRAFELSVVGGGSARQNAAPPGKRRYALVVDAPAAEKGDDTEYPVVVYAGNVQGVNEKGTIARQRNELADVKLEIMFVIESSDFMFQEYHENEGKALLDYVKSSIRELIADIRMDPQIRQAVRLGYSEYKDSVPKASFTSRLTCDLTDNFDAFSSSLDKMEASKLEDDWPDDVLSGVNEAVQNATWTENSVKHIILLGMASAQLNAQGQNPPETGNASSALEQFIAGKIPHGFNSTGLSISQLIGRGRPQGGTDSRARTHKMFHALHFGRDVEREFEQIPEADRADVRKKLDEFSAVVDGMSQQEVVSALGNPKLAPLMGLCRYMKVHKHQRDLALGQYKEISKNNGEADGIFEAVEPGPEHVQRSAASLSNKIRETFGILEKVREGEGLPSEGQNEISQPLFTLVGAAAEKFKDSPVIEGTATVRDTRGREVAFKKVMVSENELRRLRSTLDALFTKFKSKTSKTDRQDVGTLLNTMKEVVAETSAGQEVTANAPLKQLISDLPLRTAALDTSVADLALMTNEAFKEWLDRVESAVFRIDDLLTNRQDWLTLSDHAVNDKFTFLRLSELP